MTCVTLASQHLGRRPSTSNAGWWTYRVEAGPTPMAWEHDGTIQGRRRRRRRRCSRGPGHQAGHRCPGRSPSTPSPFCRTRSSHRDTARPAQARLQAGTPTASAKPLARHPLREMVSPNPRYRLLVERQLQALSVRGTSSSALRGCRFDAATGRHGPPAPADRRQRLPPSRRWASTSSISPIHPIGSAAKKGKNNTLGGGPDDPGRHTRSARRTAGTMPSTRPGHLRGLRPLRRRRRRPRPRGRDGPRVGCSPTTLGHGPPGVVHHPADGTIAYAENPPKKYQDPMNFDNDPAGIYAEVRRWSSRSGSTTA